MGRKKSLSANWQLGTVHWFDEKSGEGMIKAEDGRSYYVHYSAIVTKKKWKSLKGKKRVQFQVFEDVTFTQIARVKEL